jgi:hypothetical protein
MPDVVPPYRERLWPAWWVFVATALVVPASLLVFLPISVPAGIVVAVGLYGAIVLLLVVTTPLIEVSGSELRAGRARLPRAAIGEVAVAEGPDAVAERGARLDARAWLVLRGWIPGVVRVEVRDAADPTPYWLLSSRRPAELAAALRGRAGGT